jgi:hypothetical protein
MPRSLAFLAALLLGLAGPALADSAAGVRLKVIPEFEEVTAGDSLRVGALVDNPTRTDHFVILDVHLAPVEEPILTPPVTRWERFVYELLAKITGDYHVLFVPAGQTRSAILTVEVHPRMHGRFDVVGIARTMAGSTSDRASILSKITAPPSNGGVLVHGRVYELGPCRLLVTDDGHIYEPKGPAAKAMFDLLDYIYPRPDGVTVLGGILPNTVGCFGVELRVDLFRYDREPGTPVGVRWRTIARGRSPRPYSGPREEIVRGAWRLKQVVDALGAELIGPRPDFRKEMVAVVTTPGTVLTRIRVGRIFEKNGVLRVHYTVVNPWPGCPLPASLRAEVAKPYCFAQPYHLVALPIWRGPIRFVRHDVRIRCDAAKTGSLSVVEELPLSASKALVAEPVTAMEGTAVK